MYIVCYLDYLIIQYFSDVLFRFHSGLYHCFLIISILTWNYQWIGVSAYLFYELYIFCVFIWAKHTIAFLLKVIMFLYLYPELTLFDLFIYIYVLALIRYYKVPSNIKRVFNQYAGNFSLIWCTHTHTQECIFFNFRLLTNIKIQNVDWH